MVGDGIRDVLKESHIHVYGTIISIVVVAAGVAFLVKSYYELRNNFANYRISQYVIDDWKKKNPTLVIKEY
jgi:hypothetical protein